MDNTYVYVTVDIAHPLHSLFGRGQLQEFCGRQRRVSLLWRWQVGSRGTVDWRQDAVVYGETVLQPEVPLPTTHHVADH